MTDEIDDLVEKLKIATLNNNNDEILTLLDTLITSDTKIKLHDKLDLRETIAKLIKIDNHQVQVLAAKSIAEITKAERQRIFFTEKNVIEILIGILATSVGDFPNNLELTVQVCRALGNICYANNNNDARNIILSVKGDEQLIKLLDIKAQCDKDDQLQFIKVRGGLISNYLLGGETFAKRAMNLKIMDKIQTIVDICMVCVEENEELLLNVLPPLSILTENVADLNFDSKLNKQLAQILAASKNPDLAEMCLELLHYQAENDDVKLLLAKEGLCETIYKLLEKYKTLASTSEARALMKLACDLIVLILTGDDSMHYLYSTPLLKDMENWLDSNDTDLLTTGVLSLGNFARSDSHCIYMVENKIMNKLLEILSKNNGIDNDMRLQHALLSALRNLVIPRPNKSPVIEAGLVRTILPMLEIHQPPVVFKLLGTLRMTVDGQENLAHELLKNRTLIEQLIHWSKSSDYAGVTGESLRLMAWLIKNAYMHRTSTPPPIFIRPLDDSNITNNSLQNPIEDGASAIPATSIDTTSLMAFVKIDGSISSMINMLTSQHLVMQNEALIALSILSTIFLCKQNGDPNDIQLENLFIQFELGKNLAEFLNRSSDSMTKEIVENLHKFTALLRKSEKLIKHLSDNNIDELLKSIPILTEYCTL